MIWLIIPGVVVALVILGVVKHKRRLSWPAKTIMKKYNALPKDSQRFPGLKEKLIALDKKLGVNEVDNHFMYKDYDRTPKIGWRNCHPHGHDASGYASYKGQRNKKCKYNIYKQLCKEVEDLQEAVDKQDEAMQLAGIDNLGLGQLLEDIRGERSVIETVTKEML